mgnify:FL=1
MERLFFVLPVVVMCTLAGEGVAAPRIGGGADAHGCYATAGYLWCARTKQCERPWELARARGFKNSMTAFRRFCGAR